MRKKVKKWRIFKKSLKKDLPNRFSCGIIDELSGCGAAGRGEMPPPVADEGIAPR